MSDDLKFKLIVVGVGGVLVWYAGRKLVNGISNAGSSALSSVEGALSGAASAVGNAAGEGFQFVANLPSMGWQAMNQSSTLQADAGSTLADGNLAVFGVNDAGGTVAPTGSLGIAVQQLWNNLTGNSAAGLDYGTGPNNWSG